MATKLPAAQKRIFTNIFICKKCCRRMKTQAGRILLGKVKCRGCGGHSFRPIKKK